MDQNENHVKTFSVDLPVVYVTETPNLVILKGGM
jgi:hypothetical protein